MSQNNDLSALAERVEGLEGPDREVDALIARSLADERQAEHWFAIRGEWFTDDKAPAYTSSLDAAKSLADGRRISLNIAEDQVTLAIVDGTQGCAATPPLALTAAALRARSHGEEG